MIKQQYYIEKFKGELDPDAMGTLLTLADLAAINGKANAYTDEALSAFSLAHFDGPHDSLADIRVPYNSGVVYLVGTAEPYIMYAELDGNPGTLERIGVLDADLSDYITKDAADAALADKADAAALAGLAVTVTENATTIAELQDCEWEDLA